MSTQKAFPNRQIKICQDTQPPPVPVTTAYREAVRYPLTGSAFTLTTRSWGIGMAMG